MKIPERSCNRLLLSPLIFCIPLSFCLSQIMSTGQIMPIGKSTNCMISPCLCRQPEHANTSATALRPMMQFCTPAYHTHNLPEVSSNSLLSIRTFSDNGYPTIFHYSNKGVKIHDCNGITITSTQCAVLREWRNDKGLYAFLAPHPTASCMILYCTASTMCTISPQQCI